MFDRFPKLSAVLGSQRFDLSLGTRGDDLIELDKPGVTFSGPGDDVIVTTSGPHILFTGTGHDTVQTGGGLTRVIAQGDVTVEATGGITRVTLSEGSTGNAVVESHEGGMSPPDIIIWDIAGDGESSATFGGVLWDLGVIGGLAAEVSLQDALDDVTFTLSSDGAQANIALAQDALLIINELSRPASLEEMIRLGEFVLQVEVGAGITVTGSEARDIITLDETVEDAFVFLSDSGVDADTYLPYDLTDVLITSYSTSGSTGNVVDDTLRLSGVTQDELDRALASQVRTEDGAVVTIDDLTLTFIAGEAIIVTEDFFVL